MSDDAWQVFDLHKLTAKLTAGGPQYKEFLRAPSLSCGVYHLPKGARDMQSPHDEDEVYFVLSGRARMRVSGGGEQEVREGTVLYVRATEEHSFFEIEEDMSLLVFFAASS